MATAENMFKEAALLQLTATCWQLDKKLPQALLADVGNVEYLRGRKLLLSQDCTAEIKQVIGKARNYLRRIALPFPINGCVLVPKALITEIQDNLQRFEREYNRKVEEFLHWYPQSVEDARYSLGDLFNTCDYPTREELKIRFRFQWRYIVIGPSVSRVLPPSIYREEVQKFQNLMETARQEAIAALRTEFVDLVSNIADKLSGSEDGKPKRLRDAAVENLQQFLDSFANRNMFEDDELSSLVERCQRIISGTSANSIRTNAEVKENLHNGMTNLLNSIDANFESIPRRKLRFNSAA